MVAEPRRAAFLSAPRLTLGLELLSPALKGYLARFEDVEKVEARTLVVDGVTYFELLRTYVTDDEDIPGGRFVTGTIVDASAHEVVDLDFTARLATFPPGVNERARDQRLTSHCETFFTRARLDGAGLKSSEAKLPKGVEVEPGARTFRFEFEGASYFAAAYPNEEKKLEVLVFDAQGRGLGGTYALGGEPFDVAEVEPTMPLAAQPVKASGVAKSAGGDGFEAKARPKVTF